MSLFNASDNIMSLFNTSDNIMSLFNTSDNIMSFFCSTLSEFENFLLCERILINITTCQNETSS
jgi:hypothetical protein